MATYTRIIGWVKLDNPVHGRYLAEVSEISHMINAKYDLHPDPEPQHLCRSVFPWLSYRTQKRYSYAEMVRMYWRITRSAMSYLLLLLLSM